MNTLILIFYRIAAFFTRVPRKIREYNLSNNEKNENIVLSSDGYIENQGIIENIRFGSDLLKKNGCGPIATFNALKSLGENLDTNDFFKIIRAYEKNGAAFRALLGTSPISIKRYIENMGFITKTISSKSRQKLNEFAGNYDTFITIIRNNAKTLKSGLHYICIHKNADGKYVTHNPMHESDNIYDVLKMCSKDNIKHVYTIGIKRNEA